ncbi:hypothetical protein D8S78_00315 [Natrialba swarupiae]|nr:hypothetical protein [Natrialba swarupiae]
MHPSALRYSTERLSDTARNGSPIQHGTTFRVRSSSKNDPRVFGTVGFYSKPAEDIEEIDRAQMEAIRATGADGFQVMVYGVLPQILPGSSASRSIDGISTFA